LYLWKLHGSVFGIVTVLLTYEGARPENVIVANRESLGLYCVVVNVFVIGRCLGHGNFQILATFCIACRSCEWVFVVPSSVNFCSSPSLFVLCQLVADCTAKLSIVIV